MAINTLSIRIQAPSKIILTGENAVMFGASIVACAVNLKNYCTIYKWKNQFFRISINSKIVEFDKKNCIEAYDRLYSLCKSENYSAINTILQSRMLIWVKYVFGQVLKMDIEIPYFYANIDLDAPLGSGVGGSATTTVLILRAIGQLIRWKLPAKTLFNIAYLGDKIAHGGRASGTDCATIVYGCCISHHLKKGIRQIKLHSPLRFLICNSGEEKNNADSLAKFNKQKSENPNEFSKDIAKFGDLSKRLISILENSCDIQSIGGLMNENQSLLRKYELSSHQIDTIIQQGLESGACGAKLTGGGGGGAVIMIAENDAYKNIVTKLKNLGKKTFVVKTLNCN